MAANTIEPAIGASTWALGSHKCIENIGNLVTNPRIKINQKNQLFNIDGRVRLLVNMLEEFIEIDIIITSIGKEAKMVYIIRYIPACNRSGWYPHNKMMSRVGIKEASNQM